MQKVIAIFVFGLVCFGLGYLSSVFTATDSTQNNRVIHLPDSATEQNSVANELIDLNNASNSQLAENQAKVRDQSEQIHKIIQQASLEKVDEYLTKAFPKANFEQIRDRKKMAQRLVDEFTANQNDDQEHLKGRVIVTAQEKSPIQVEDIQDIYPQQQLFAHLDTLNSIENPQQVFIRWINRNTGEVLLFTPQRVSNQNSSNWISFVPPQGWTAGTYDVRYYQMNDDLQPIAQTTFTIRSIKN